MLNPGMIRNIIPAPALGSVMGQNLQQVIIPIVNNKLLQKMPTGKPHGAPTIQLNRPNPAQFIPNQQLASTNQRSNMIILHNASANQKSGSFSLQHLTNQKVGSVAIEHGHGNMFVTRTPNTGIQLVQPVAPNLVFQQRAPVTGVNSAIAPPAVSMFLPTAQPVSVRQPVLMSGLPLTMGLSAKHHLQELLPVLPTLPSSDQ